MGTRDAALRRWRAAFLPSLSVNVVVPYASERPGHDVVTDLVTDVVGTLGAWVLVQRRQRETMGP